jgi:type II secretory ATPase GspE/PulE/Tfp pilus assembly ATPase PilB-like protein
MTQSSGPLLTEDALLSDPTDSERAVALLVMEHALLDPAATLRLLVNSRNALADVAHSFAEAAGEVAVVSAAAQMLGLRFIDLDGDTSLKPDMDMVSTLGLNALQRYSALPLIDPAGQGFVAVANPADVGILDFLRSRPGAPTRLVLSTSSQIQARLTYAVAEMATAGLDDIRGSRTMSSGGSAQALPLQVGRNPVVEWVDGTLARAVTEGASDIHLEFNSDEQMQVRFRVDGILDLRQVGLKGRDREVVGAILGRCPSMDPANLLEPQDGTFSFTAAGRVIDVRVAMLPMEHGPSVVMRLLDSSKLRVRLEDMGFSTATLLAARDVTSAAQGLVLVSGPTGSGKTTTLYSLLREVDAVTRRVVTVEDPIEYRLPNIGQVQIRNDRGERSLTFQRALRSILRMDPDVILVGEIRDTETARVAADASITGHLVLSTIHASGAVSTYTRLIEMGVPSYVASEAISLTVAQRLVRRVHECVRMEHPSDLDALLLASKGLEVPDYVPVATGCPGCQGRGFKGRIAVVEMLPSSPAIRALAASRAPTAELHRQAISEGFAPLLHDGYRHMRSGLTTVGEIFRVLSGSAEETS